MKVFIWEHVLADYTDGMAVAYAENLEQALTALRDDCIRQHTVDFITKDLGLPTTVIDCDTDAKPQAAWVTGGG